MKIFIVVFAVILISILLVPTTSPLFAVLVTGPLIFGILVFSDKINDTSKGKIKFEKTYY